MYESGQSYYVGVIWENMTNTFGINKTLCQKQKADSNLGKYIDGIPIILARY